jgi:hypothetical protein
MIDSWARVSLIVCVIILNGVLEVLLILGAEFMMFARWARDVVRYDFRWVVQEKARLIWRGRHGSTGR